MPNPEAPMGGEMDGYDPKEAPRGDMVLAQWDERPVVAYQDYRGKWWRFEADRVEPGLPLCISECVPYRWWPMPSPNDARSARRSAIEEAAKVAEEFPSEILHIYNRGPNDPPGNMRRQSTRGDIASAIRALAEKG